MPTLTGRRTRTSTGYVITLLEYPRLMIEREVDFTNCPHLGRFADDDMRCTSCRFGTACRWLNVNAESPDAASPLPELLEALDTAVNYLRSAEHDPVKHVRGCDCDNCQWLHEAMSFLRLHRHKSN